MTIFLVSAKFMIMSTFDTNGQCTDFGSNVMNAGDSLRVNESVLNCGKDLLELFFR